jgi:hypothetical protein
MRAIPTTVTIRRAYPDDDPAIWRLAALDSAAVPAGPFLVAEVEDKLRAALSLATHQAIADPFHPTLRLVAMLREYAGAAADQRAASRRLGRRYRPGRLALEY